jgi:hypothetical protein
MEPRPPYARALLALPLLLALSCASGVGDSEFDDVDSAASVADPDGAEEEAGDDGWIAPPMAPEAGSIAPADSGGTQGASDAGARDAGGGADASGMSRADAGLDAGMSGANDAGLDSGTATRDAGGSASDAGGASDAGRDSGAQRDSGQSGGGTPGGGASCDPANCEGCSVVGPFPCCRDNNTCGCTWAPGGYCL